MVREITLLLPTIYSHHAYTLDIPMLALSTVVTSAEMNSNNIVTATVVSQKFKV